MEVDRDWDDVVESYRNQVSGALESTENELDKKLVMAWFWAGYYQGEHNAEIKYKDKISDLELELEKLRKKDQDQEL